MSDSARGDYPVGKGRPPKAYQWRKGQSGNPSGARSRQKQVADVVAAALCKRVRVREGGQIRSRSYLEVVIERLVRDAANGDPKARSALFSLVRQSEDRTDSPVTSDALPPEDVAIIQAYFDELNRTRGADEAGE